MIFPSITCLNNFVDDISVELQLFGHLNMHSVLCPKPKPFKLSPVCLLIMDCISRLGRKMQRVGMS